MKKIVSTKKFPLFKNYNENYIKLTGKAEKELIARGEGKAGSVRGTSSGVVRNFFYES